MIRVGCFTSFLLSGFRRKGSTALKLTIGGLEPFAFCRDFQGYLIRWTAGFLLQDDRKLLHHNSLAGRCNDTMRIVGFNKSTAKRDLITVEYIWKL